MEVYMINLTILYIFEIFYDPNDKSWNGDSFMLWLIKSFQLNGGLCLQSVFQSMLEWGFNVCVFFTEENILKDTYESSMIFINLPETTTKITIFIVVVNKVGEISKIKPLLFL